MGELVEQLAREYQKELAAAGTLVDLEELSCQLGDEVTRQLTERELVRRSRDYSPLEAACPDCGCLCPRADPEPVVLNGLRGDVAYNQPQHDCPRCRRSFFPDGGFSRPAAPQHGDAEGVA